MQGAAPLNEDNFITKHWVNSHEDLLSPPIIRFRVIKACKDAMTRLLAESVWIYTVSNLNSKNEWRGNKVARITVSGPGAISDDEQVDKEVQNKVLALKVKIPQEQEKNCQREMPEHKNKSLQPRAKPAIFSHTKRQGGKATVDEHKRKKLKCNILDPMTNGEEICMSQESLPGIQSIHSSDQKQAESTHRSQEDFWESKAENK